MKATKCSCFRISTNPFYSKWRECYIYTNTHSSELDGISLNFRLFTNTNSQAYPLIHAHQIGILLKDLNCEILLSIVYAKALLLPLLELMHFLPIRMTVNSLVYNNRSVARCYIYVKMFGSPFSMYVIISRIAILHMKTFGSLFSMLQFMEWILARAPANAKTWCYLKLNTSIIITSFSCISCICWAYEVWQRHWPLS